MQRRARGPPCFLLVVVAAAPLLLLAAAGPAPAWSAPSDDQPACTSTSSSSSSGSSATAGCRGRSSAGIGGSSRSLLQQQQQLTPANSTSVLPAAAASANASSGSNATVVAANYTCRLAIVGFRNSSPAAVQWASLECSPASPPLRVGFNSSISGLNASSGNFSSVQLVPDGGLPCQAAFSQRSQFGLLFFCDDAPAAATAAARQQQQLHTITLLQPLVQGVQLAALPSGSSSSSGSDQPPSYDAALLVFGGSVRAVLRGAQLSNNRAGTPLLVGDAAAVEVTDGSRLAGNTATAGGAIKAAGAASVVVSGSSVLSGNTAEFAGALHVSGNASLLLDGVTVVGSNASQAAGALFANNTAVTIRNSSFANNTANNKDGKGGGGCFLLVAAARCSVEDSNITSCRIEGSESYGGAFYLKDSATLSVAGSLVAGSKAGKQGGGISLDQGASCTITRGSQLARNKCRLQGAGVFANDDSSVVVDGGSSFVANDAGTGNGGGIFITKRANLTVAGPVLFQGNRARFGAALNLYNSDANFASSGCLARLSGVQFEGNTAEGGAAIVANAQCRVLADGCLFAGNTAAKAGVVSFDARSSGTFSNCTWVNSTAIDGAALALSANSSVALAGCLLRGQRAAHNGAAFFVADGSSLSVSGTTVVDSRALFGGALWAGNDATVSFDNSSILNAAANVSGGAAYLMDAASLALTNGSRCVGNTAGTSGGCVVLLNRASLALSAGSVIAGNRARYGGGVSFVAMDVPVDLAAFEPPAVANNSASQYNSNVYIDMRALRLTFSAVVFSDSMGNDSAVWQGPQLPRELEVVSRSEGVSVQVSLDARGEQGRPASGVRLTAALLRGRVAAQQEAEARQLASTTTDESGRATFGSLVVREAPGRYTLRFEYINLDGQAFRAQVALAVRPCRRGEVSNGRPDVCDVCPPGQFSLAARPSRESSCQPCSPGMDCSLGGAVVLPAPGFYTFEPDEGVAHRCPNPAACSNVPDLLLAVHPFFSPGTARPPPSAPALMLLVGADQAAVGTGSAADNSSAGNRTFSAFESAQCAAGYTGPLCAACLPGHGQTRQFRCGTCYPPATLAGLFVAAAVALMCGIRLLTHFSTTSDARVMAAAAAAPAAVQPPPAVPTARTGSGSGSSLLPTTMPATGPPAESMSGPAGAAAGAAASSAGPSSAAPASARAAGGKPAGVPRRVSAVYAADSTSLPSSLLKVLVLYTQYMVLIGGLAVAWPAALAGPLTALAGLWSFTSSEALSLECLGRPASMPAGVLRVLVYVCMPLVMFCLLVALEWPAKAAWLWARAALPAWCACNTSHPVTGFHKARRQAAAAATTAASAQQSAVDLSPAGDSAPASPGFRRLERSAAFSVRPMHTPFAAAAAAAPQAATAPAGLRTGARPTAAWCGVLAMVIVFFFYPSLARATLGLFVCISLRGDTAAAVASRTLWLVDLQQECLGPGYKAWALGLGVPLLLVVFVCLPVSVGVLLWVGRRQGQQQWLVQHFTFLFAHYRPGCYMWEVVTMLQTLLLVVVSVFAYQLGPFYQALLLNAVLAVIAVMLLWFRPYATRRVQHVAVAAVACQLLTSYAALSFIPTPESVVLLAVGSGAGRVVDQGLSSNLMRSYEVYKQVWGAVVLVANVAFIVVWLALATHVASSNETLARLLGWCCSSLLPALRFQRAVLALCLRRTLHRCLGLGAAGGGSSSAPSPSASGPLPASGGAAWHAWRNRQQHGGGGPQGMQLQAWPSI